MTEQEKIAYVQLLVGDEPEITEAVISVYLGVAQNKILAKLFPFGDGTETMPAQYDITQCELTARLCLRRGAEGEISHNENGINRSYKTVDDDDILGRIMPYVAVI